MINVFCKYFYNILSIVPVGKMMSKPIPFILSPREMRDSASTLCY